MKRLDVFRDQIRLNEKRTYFELDYKLIDEIGNFVDERNELRNQKQELINYLKEEIKDGRPKEKDKHGNILLWYIEYFDACKDILSKIEKSDD